MIMIYDKGNTHCQIIFVLLVIYEKLDSWHYYRWYYLELSVVEENKIVIHKKGVIPNILVKKGFLISSFADPVIKSS